MTVLAVALGGALGAVSRYLFGAVVQRAAHAGFPVGTLVVNVIGCAFVGYLTQQFMNVEPPPLVRGFLVVGFCGGFTTFSAFGAETIGLYAAGASLRAMVYVSVSLVSCLLAVVGGMAVARVSQ